MLSFFPRGVLDEILNLTESVSEGFPSYSFIGLCLSCRRRELNSLSNHFFSAAFTGIFDLLHLAIYIRGDIKKF